MKIYLASSWRNALQPSVLAELRSAGHEVYDFKNPAIGNSGFGWRQCTDAPIDDCRSLRAVLRHPIAQRGFDFDFGAMKWADACVLLLPCGNSAHLEAGWFSGKGKPVVVFVPELREPELMYKLFDTRDAWGARGSHSLPLSEWETPLFEKLEELLAHLETVNGKA